MLHASDVSAWKTVLDLTIFLSIVSLFVWTMYTVFTRKDVERSTMIVISVLFFALLLAHILNAFYIFDSGKIPEVTPVEDDGHAKIVQTAPDLTPEDQLTAAQEAKKNKHLRAQDQGPEEARKESEAYLQKVLDRNK